MVGSQCLYSEQAWGAVYDSSSTRGDWDLTEQALHINVLEMKGALCALKSFCNNMSNVHIQIRLDNTTAVAYINHMGGAKSLQCNAVAKEIWSWCIERDLWLSSCHVPGVDNVADHESRQSHDQMEWKLDVNVFQQICDLWAPDIDLFASRINHQLPQYVCGIQT